MSGASALILTGCDFLVLINFMLEHMRLYAYAVFL